MLYLAPLSQNQTFDIASVQPYDGFLNLPFDLIHWSRRTQATLEQLCSLYISGVVHSTYSIPFVTPYMHNKSCLKQIGLILNSDKLFLMGACYLAKLYSRSNASTNTLIIFHVRHS